MKTLILRDNKDDEIVIVEGVVGDAPRIVWDHTRAPSKTENSFHEDSVISFFKAV